MDQDILFQTATQGLLGAKADLLTVIEAMIVITCFIVAFGAIVRVINVIAEDDREQQRMYDDHVEHSDLKEKATHYRERFMDHDDDDVIKKEVYKRKYSKVMRKLERHYD